MNTTTTLAFYAKDGWTVEQPPFVYPTKKNAMVTNGRGVWIHGEGFWRRPGIGGSWTEYDMRVNQKDADMRVIFAGED